MRQLTVSRYISRHRLFWFYFYFLIYFGVAALHLGSFHDAECIGQSQVSDLHALLQRGLGQEDGD